MTTDLTTDPDLTLQFIRDAMPEPLPGAQRLTFGRHRGRRTEDVARRWPRYAAKIISDGEFGTPELWAELWRFMPPAYQDAVLTGLGQVLEDDGILDLLASRQR